MNLEVLRLLLSPLGHKLTCASNGLEALNSFVANLREANKNPSQTFDIIIMDEQMPEMDGVEATRKIREVEREQNSPLPVPIIGCSANVQQTDKIRLLAAGMSDTLSKPITAKGIVEKLSLWCKSHSTCSGLSYLETSGTPTGNRELGTSLVFDTVDLLDRYNNNQSIIDEMLALFDEELPEFLIEIEKALETRDSDKLRRSAHSLKGVLQNLSGTSAAEAASSLEMLAKAADFESCLKADEKLKQELKLLDVEIKSYRALNANVSRLHHQHSRSWPFHRSLRDSGSLRRRRR